MGAKMATKAPRSVPNKIQILTCVGIFSSYKDKIYIVRSHYLPLPLYTHPPPTPLILFLIMKVTP